MWKNNFLLLLLFCSFSFSQTKTISLENKIYNALDFFVENPSIPNLEKLEILEKSFHPKTSPEYLAVVIVNCNKAYYQNQFGFTEKAIKSYEKAWQIYQQKKLSNYDISDSCLKPLGNLYTIIGDYENAENTIKQYFYIANFENNEELKVAAMINLSTVFQYSGKHLEAIKLLEKTVSSAKLSKIQKGVLQNNLGNSYLASKNKDAAENCYKKSIILLSNTTKTEALANAYRNIAILNNDLKLFKKAKATFLKNTNNSSRELAKINYDEAFINFENGDYDATQNLLKQLFSRLLPNYSESKTVLPKQNLLYAETILLDALDLQAALFLSQNLPKKALQSYQLSFHVEELLQSLLVYENSKIITQVGNRNRVEKCIKIYVSLYQKEKNTIYLERAFLIQEQSKSMVLQKYLIENKNKTREEKLITAQLQNWNTIILKEQQKDKLADIAIINDAIKKQNELMLLLKANRNETSKKTEAIKLSDLYVKLKTDDAILIEYFCGEETIYCFTIENEKITVDEITDLSSKKSRIYQYLNYFTDASLIEKDIKSFSETSNSIYKLFRFPKTKKDQNLILIPDGFLNFLPFESLISEKKNTSNFNKMHYLLNDFTISYAISSNFYLNSLPLQPQDETVLGVFPIFEKSNLELTFSKEELHFIKSNFKGKYLEKQQATYKNFQLNSSNFTIMHLSTHASSGEIYEPATIRFFDQEVMYSELYNLSINPNLVVLSACETGLGKWFKAEGALSIARGFQFAGAQNLLFSLWKVNDYTTSVIMKNFYENIKNGSSYAKANHYAKLNFLADETISNTKKSPYYWSSFVYYGTLEAKSSTNYLAWICIAVGLIALFLVLKQLRNARTSKNTEEE